MGSRPHGRLIGKFFDAYFRTVAHAKFNPNANRERQNFRLLSCNRTRTGSDLFVFQKQPLIAKNSSGAAHQPAGGCYG
jgi:hypothetical protein